MYREVYGFWLEVKWSFPFGGPSGASPLLIDDTIYFDGNRNTQNDLINNVHVFAVKDTGNHGKLVWKRFMGRFPILASFAQDPRGGFWCFNALKPWIYRLDFRTGKELNAINVNKLLDKLGLYVPSSVLTVTWNADNPIIICGAVAVRFRDSSWVIAIDLKRERLLWKVKFSDRITKDFTAGQFAIVKNNAGEPVVVFTGLREGAYGIMKDE